ncbi:unnamed protein product [Lactuca saligna]|uniref:DUF4283 domain-containing protein n=1 Tax=Lactuca saligna TaxID=75948 RepID=A0AA35YQG2_LACSI|nr:unnamed protein product [Lactuca saligna]
MACLIKARDFSTLLNLRVLCLNEGFDNFEMRYVGGLWVLIEFTSTKACKFFMESNAMDHWLLEKRAWDRYFAPLERKVWVDVEGLPLSVWSKESFRKIISKWGTIVHLDDNLGEDIYKNMICILSSFQTIISDVIKVRVEGVTYSIRVKEAPGWTPSFVHDFPAPELNESELPDQDQNEGQSHYFDGNEDISSDPFGIYDVIENMKMDELNNDISKRFNCWGNGKKNKDINDSPQGKNGHSSTENFFYSSPPNHKSAGNTPAVSHPCSATRSAPATPVISTTAPVASSENSLANDWHSIFG